MASRPSPVVHYVHFVYQIVIRGRNGKRRFRIEIISSIRNPFRLYEFRPTRIPYTKSTNFVDFVYEIWISSIRISSPNQFVYTKFVSRGAKLALDEFRLSNFDTKSTIGDEFRIRNSSKGNFIALGTKFV